MNNDKWPMKAPSHLSLVIGHLSFRRDTTIVAGRVVYSDETPRSDQTLQNEALFAQPEICNRLIPRPSARFP
jgi:hypothetical protein